MFREAIHPEKGIVSSINADEKLQKENEYSKESTQRNAERERKIQKESRMISKILLYTPRHRKT